MAIDGLVLVLILEDIHGQCADCEIGKRCDRIEIDGETPKRVVKAEHDTQREKERRQMEEAAEREKAFDVQSPVEYVFNVGERVFHDKLGIGHITDVIKVGDSMMYTIDFGKQGKKAMDAAYAKLKKF